MAGGEEGARGFLDAYRASTGERVWRFYTIPKRGEPGSETWIGQALEHGCGATWMPGSYDPELDLIYWAIGNPCPDFAGEERIGDNLYTSSVVALEAKTGRLKWYYQFTPHDTHDWDAVQPMVLADEVWEGKPRKLLFHGDRNGIFYVLDRTNGQVLKTGNLSTKVTWVKGFAADGKPIVDPGSIATREGHRRLPGRRRRREFSRRVVQPGHEAVLRARQRQLPGVHITSKIRSAREEIAGSAAAPPSEKARAALAALTKGYTMGTFIRAMDPFAREESVGLPEPRRRAGHPVDRDRPGVPSWRRRPARPRRQDREGCCAASTSATFRRPRPMTYMVGGKQYIALHGMEMLAVYAVH